MCIRTAESPDSAVSDSNSETCAFFAFFFFLFYLHTIFPSLSPKRGILFLPIEFFLIFSEFLWTLLSIFHDQILSVFFSDSVKQADLIDKPKDLSIFGCLFAEQYSYIQKTVDVIFHSGCRVRILHHILNPIRNLPGIICMKCRQSVKTCRKHSKDTSLL